MYSISEISSIVKGEVLNNNENLISHVFTDSRTISNAENGLFIALVTPRNNGHNYLQEAYKLGIRSFIIQEIVPVNLYPNACFISVKSTWEALHTFAKFHRLKFNIPIIGITGSNGKTVVKEFLYQLLSPNFDIVRSPKSYNSKLGVPLSLLNINEGNTLGIFEAGISEPNEMAVLEQLIRPSIGIFTNIGTAHKEFFISKQAKISEKLNLFKQAELIFYCSAHEAIVKEIETKYENSAKLFSWGYLSIDTMYIKTQEISNSSTKLTLQYSQKSYSFEFLFTDKANVENICHCIAVLLYFEISEQEINKRLKLLVPVNMRLEFKKGINNCNLINDSYSSDTSSLKMAMDILIKQPQAQKTVILSDLLESGRTNEILYSRINEILSYGNISKLIGIGENISANKHVFNGIKDMCFFNNTQDFIKNYHTVNFSNEVILIKGARVFEFEKIISHLAEQKAETTLEVNLSNITHNLNYFRNKVAPETKIMCMVKALGYGSGLVELAKHLEYNGVNYLGVAYADEGVKLRQSGIKTPVMVMNPDIYSFSTCINFNLEPEIYNFRTLDALINEVKRNALFEFKIHIKIDTGMHRLGFEESDISNLISRLNDTPEIKIASIFSHLAASDNDALMDFSLQQIQQFERLSNEIICNFNYNIERHICNSNAIEKFPKAHYNMVRLGISLFGIGNPTNQDFLQFTSALKTQISQIKYLNKHETVGYNCNGKIYKASAIATIPIGYADGFNRKLGNGNGTVYINSIPVKTIGNICMDMTMIDITDINCSEGDEVVIFNSNKHIMDIASKLDTIPYEILTSISSRVKRIYIEE